MQNYKKILRLARFYVKEHNCRTVVKQRCRFDKIKHHRGCCSASRWCWSLVAFGPASALLGFLFVSVAAEGFVDGETGVTDQPLFEVFAERSGRVDYIKDFVGLYSEILFVLCSVLERGLWQGDFCFRERSGSVPGRKQ